MLTHNIYLMMMITLQPYAGENASCMCRIIHIILLKINIVVIYSLSHCLPGGKSLAIMASLVLLVDWCCNLVDCCLVWQPGWPLILSSHMWRGGGGEGYSLLVGLIVAMR